MIQAVAGPNSEPRIPEPRKNSDDTILECVRDDSYAAFWCGVALGKYQRLRFRSAS
jgi:hypothetical protein